MFGKLAGLSTFESLWIARILCFCLMLACNAAVWTFYVKALHSSDSTLSATVASTASNYIFSALFGFVLFNEATSLLWWTGMSFVLFGLILMVRDEPETTSITIKEKIN
ncbi:hypothetical protein CBL_13344 [Carabus blaptoides fortunei]